MTIDELKTQLADIGFRFGVNPFHNSTNEVGWYAWRRSAHPARRCENNVDKEGMQVVVYPYQSVDANTGKMYSSAEIELCGESNGVWYKMRAYSIPIDEFLIRFPDIESRLIAAWNALESTP